MSLRTNACAPLIRIDRPNRAHDVLRIKEAAMTCPTCRRAMLSSSCQEIQDDKGAMTVTRWRCRPCHETAEEIWISADFRGAVPRRICYAVASAVTPKQPVRSYGGSRRGALANAVAC